MRILIAASIYPPEVGGPSQYAAGLNDALQRGGHDTAVCIFSRYRWLPSGVRHLVYTFALLSRASAADAIIAFDTVTVGIPALIASRLSRKPLVVRVGGDFLWEHYVQRTGERIPLPSIYEKRDAWSAKERRIFQLTQRVLMHETIAFSTAWQKDIWEKAYGSIPRAVVIENAIPPRRQSAPPMAKNFLVFGRRIALKNLDAFRRSFENVQRTHPEISLEEGNVPYMEYLNKVSTSYAVAIPSLSEISPNTVIDVIRCGKPFLLTKYSGYTERYGEYGIIVDPLDEADMARGIEQLLDPAEYARLAKRIAEFKVERTYDEVARDFLAVIR